MGYCEVQKGDIQGAILEKQKGPVIPLYQIYLQGANMRLKFKSSASPYLSSSCGGLAHPPITTASLSIPQKTGLPNQHCVKSFLVR